MNIHSSSVYFSQQLLSIGPRKNISSCRGQPERQGIKEKVRKALRALRQGRVTGAELVAPLPEIYRRYGLDQVRARRRDGDRENDSLPHIVCSEGLAK